MDDDEADEETYVTVLVFSCDGKHFAGKVSLQIVECNRDIGVLDMTCESKLFVIPNKTKTKEQKTKRGIRNELRAPSTPMKIYAPATLYKKTTVMRKMWVNHLRDHLLTLS